MVKYTLHKRLLLSCMALTAVSCAESASESPSSSGEPVENPGSAGVSQPGAADFGQFRAVLEAGEIPGPGILDDLGFFAEHKLDYPKADCEGSVCLHPLVGVMGNFLTGVDCTLIQLGMNSPLDPESLKRPALHVVLVVDTSGSMEGAPLAYLKDGLVRMLDSLGDDDRISLVRYGTDAEVLLEHQGLDDRIALESAFTLLDASGRTNIFAGLFEGYALAEAHAADPDVETRVVLMSDGVMNEGLVDLPALIGLAKRHARTGIGLTTIGAGREFDPELMRGLAEAGAGNFYFLDDPAAMVEVFSQEVDTFLVPIALDVTIETIVSDGYRLGATYGTNGFTANSHGGTIELPVLFLAGRRSASEPITGGRRGGGGAILYELMRDRDAEGEAWSEVGTVRFSYTDPRSGQRISEEAQLDVPESAWVIPDGGWFSDFTVEKAFVMLNLYAAFELAVELAWDSDLGSALGTLKTVRASVSDWLIENDDADIADDMRYVDMFIEAIEAEAARSGVPVVRSPAPQPRYWFYD
ncbi:MAG: VWA domain-containing protein [Myxococcales bacterium]|nr:VWA domain-containing protein [Myxococcales bacterium]